MDCKNLMIGDWIEYNDTAIQYYTKVYGFTEYGDVVIKLKDKNEPIPMSISYIRPIPITRAMLKNNGFFDNPNWYYGIFIFPQKEDNFTVNIIKKEFTPNYVHELQHELRLFGLNDLADNLTIE